MAWISEPEDSINSCASTTKIIHSMKSQCIEIYNKDEDEIYNKEDTSCST